MRRFRMQLFGGAGFVFLVLLGSLLHIPQWVTHAAIYSPPANSTDRIPYQSSSTDPELSSGPGSGGVNTAMFTFAAPPAGYRLVVENISAVVAATQANVAVGAYLYAAADGTEISHPAKYFSAVVGAGAVANVDEDIRACFDAAGEPKLQLTLAAGGVTTTPMAILTGYLEA